MGGNKYLDGIRVRRTLRRVDKLVSEALCYGFHVAERALPGLHQTHSFKASANLNTEVKAEPHTPMVMREMDWLTRRRGETSTA